MSAYAGQNVVEDGLFMHFDAADPKSYSGSGSTWFDRSTNGIDGTLNTPTFSSFGNGSFLYNGTSDRVDPTFTNQAFSGATFACWIYRVNTTASGYSGLVMNRVGGGAEVSGMLFSSDGLRLAYIWQGGSFTYNTGLTIPTGEWCYCVVSVGSAETIFFMNGEFHTRTIAHTAATMGAGFQIGHDGNASRYNNSYYATASFYDRALTREEILQNYNATKSRFQK